jgi:hypothetical protein
MTQAEQLYQRALAIDEQSLGPDHPNVARDLNNLATLFKDTDRPAEAESLLRRVVATLERGLGEGHPHVAIALNASVEI